MVMSIEDRRASALKAGIKLAKKVGAKRLSTAAVAAELKVTAPLLFHIFGTTAEMQKAVEKEAKKQGVVLAVGAPTVRERAAATKKAPTPSSAKLTVAIKKAVKPPAVKVTSPAKKVAALLKKPVGKSVVDLSKLKKLPNISVAVKGKVKKPAAPVKNPVVKAVLAAPVVPTRSPVVKASSVAAAKKFDALPTPAVMLAAKE